jgi:hypothetical protein
MSILKLIAMIAALSFSANTFACDLHGNTGIVEENDLYISVDDKAAAGITKIQFNRVIDKVVKVYKDVVEDNGGKLVVERKWMDGTVNAYAKQVGDTWMVSMFGGLARHNAVTEDGFTLVVCHELGHHLGGAPKKFRNGKIVWASNEGQADYWGIMKCLRKVWANDRNSIAMRNKVVDKSVKTKCASTYRDREKMALCTRTAMAGKSIASLFRALRKLPAEVSFTTPVNKPVDTTYHGHPMPQCRLDTYLRASLCQVPTYVDVSYVDPSVGTCTRAGGQINGSRPRCWYNPKSSRYK